MPDITVYFATNRQPLTGADGSTIIDFGSELGPVNGIAIRFGSIVVTVSAGAGTIVAGSLSVAPETLSGPAPFAPQLGSETIFDALRRQMIAGNRPTIVFVHGFSNAFTDAVIRAAEIIDFFGLDANIFVFSWPSRASPLPVPLPYDDYEHDRKTAAASGPAVARTILRLYEYIDTLPSADRCRQKLHLLCHSMGNFVLRNGLQTLMGMSAFLADAASSGTTTVPTNTPDPARLRRTFDQIVLAAADEDEDAFDDANKLKYLSRLGNAVTVYYTHRDWVLSTLSAYTKFNGPRLGTFGPDNMDSISDKVSAVDVSGVITFKEDFESHQYYRRDPTVRDDIVDVLKDKAPDQIPGRQAIMTGRWRLIGRNLAVAATGTGGRG